MPGVLFCILHHFYVKFLFCKILQHLKINPGSAPENTVISPNFLVWKFCGMTQFPHSLMLERVFNSPLACNLKLRKVIHIWPKSRIRNYYLELFCLNYWYLNLVRYFGMWDTKYSKVFVVFKFRSIPQKHFSGKNLKL